MKLPLFKQIFNDALKQQPNIIIPEYLREIQRGLPNSRDYHDYICYGIENDASHHLFDLYESYWERACYQQQLEPHEIFDCPTNIPCNIWLNFLRVVGILAVHDPVVEQKKIATLARLNTTHTRLCMATIRQAYPDTWHCVMESSALILLYKPRCTIKYVQI